MKQASLFLRRLAPVLVLAAAAALVWFMLHQRQHIATRTPTATAVLVTCITVHNDDVPVTVNATGEVQPWRKIRLTPQVGGVVTDVSAAFRPGGSFHTGELLIAIDDHDYRLALTRAQNALSNANLQLEQELALAQTAIHEWQLINGDNAPPPLAAHTPQLRQARAAVAAAAAEVEQARLNLHRTRLCAPFDCLVLDTSADLGQYLAPGASVATLMDSTAVQVVVPVAVDELPWLKRTPGRAARVSVTTRRGTFTWPATLSRTMAQVDEQTRMFRLVFRVDNPATSQREMPLQPGMFVDVAIPGITLHQVAAIPRAALRDNSCVWLNVAGKLRIQPVTVLRDNGTQLLVRGLPESAQLVTSAITAAADGLALRLEESQR